MSAPDGERADVLLASLPFGLLESPSLALGLLQSRLEGAGISTIARYLTLDYAGMVGIEGYRHIVAGFPRTTDLLGEWIFSHAVHPRDPRQDHRYLDRTFGAVSPVSGRAGDDHLDALAAIKDSVIGLAATAGDFADFAAREILRHRPKVVGLTTVFQQNLATIAVASRLRALDPSVRIMVGGANCEGPMGRALADSYPVFDAVVSGEADLLVVPLVQHLLSRVPDHSAQACCRSSTRGRAPACSSRPPSCPTSMATSLLRFRTTFESATDSFRQATCRSRFRSKALGGAGGVRNTTAPSAG